MKLHCTFAAFCVVISFSIVGMIKNKPIQDPFDWLDKDTRSALEKLIECQSGIRIQILEIHNYENASLYVKAVLHDTFQETRKKLAKLQKDRINYAAHLEMCMLTSRSSYVKNNMPQLYDIICS